MDRRPLFPLASLAALAALAAAWTDAGAQVMTSEAATFDPARALLNDAPMFTPFRPTGTTRLADALRDGDVLDDTGVLVTEVGGQLLALVTQQMSYHHVAQGEMAGEPWMVTF